MPPSPTTWLAKLTLAQLRRVAFAIGAPSSGTKPVLTGQIQHELQCASAVAHNEARPEPNTGATSTGSALSVVSIDMGIRNLAYSHLVVARPATSYREGGGGGGGAPQHQQQSTSGRPSLLAWKRVVISGGGANGNGNGNGKGPSLSPTTKKRTKQHRNSDEVVASTTPLPLAADGTTTAADDANPPLSTNIGKEAFDPSTFANYAYDFIKSILSTHPPPTHVLIERQRFRSGGASAVQEWTIRVGVFEGMLHAVLRTLAAERGLKVVVQGVDPGRVTRYWLESRRSAVAPGKQRVGSSAKESKKAKIDIVGASLGSGSAKEGALVDVDVVVEQAPAGRSSSSQGDDDRQDVVQEVVDAFVARWKKTKEKNARGRKEDLAPTKGFVVKLDDLADCLLQGVAWLEWQNKRQEVLRRGAEAIAEEATFASVLDGKSSPGENESGTVKRKKKNQQGRRSSKKNSRSSDLAP